MYKRPLLILAALFFTLSFQSDAILSRSNAFTQANSIPAPADVLGFTPGDDRKLASWAKVVEYFQKLDAASDRLNFEEIGKTTMGAPFVYATISAPENLKRLGEFKEIQRQLADPRLLGSPTNPTLADRKARALIARGKTVIAITCGIHSTEVGGYLSSTLIAHRLASSNEPEIQEILRNTIILLVPSTNPDGVDIVNNWYQKTLGTPYEGTDPPELYHKYTGHDNNRDWYAFTQVETQLVVDRILNVWHPQIVHDIHQQGAFGSRLFLPPYMPPVEPNVPKQIVEGYTELGSYMAKEMRAAGFKGITTNSTYDAWSPSRAYAHYHGGVRILSETASARLATPRTIKFEELRARESAEGSTSMGYDPKVESENFGPIWRGGEWHLRDITNTMTTAAFFLLRHAAQNREHWLQRFYEIGKEAVRPRKKGELWGFELAVNGNVRHVIDALERGGVETGFLAGEKPIEVFPFEGGSIKYPSHTVVIPIDQPYGSFAIAMLKNQIYPDLRDKDNRPISPYDVTAHTLTLLKGVEVRSVVSPFKEKLMRKANVDFGIGDCELSARRSIALYRSHVPSMDEGWTKWVLQPCYQFEELTDDRIRRRSFEQQNPVPEQLRKFPHFADLKYKTIIIPDQPRAAILNGHRKGAMPEEYTGGLGTEGVKALREFVEQGGTLVCLNRASDFAIEQFKLPVRDVTDGLPRSDFYVPGSILRIELDTNNPIAKGMPKESIAWVENSPVFEVSGTGVSPVNRDQTDTGKMPVPQVKVIAWYPKDKDPLLSGWLLGADRLKGKAALVEVTMGKGRIILFGFRPQYRGQSLATYPLFFNAITPR